MTDRGVPADAAEQRGTAVPGEDEVGDEFIFREIADYTYDWESWIGPDGRTRWINPAVERITGYTVAECLERDDYPYFLIHPEDRTRIADALQHARRHVSGNDLEFRILHKRGFVRWGAISWQDLLDRQGRYRGFRTSVRDITARKAAETEILASRDEAHRASRAKSEFLAHMSHEIRTPIQNILGCAQLLQATSLDARQERFVTVLRDQSEHLLRIVDDILDFSALQSTAPRLEAVPFLVGAVVRAVVEGARGAALAKGIALELELRDAEDLAVRGDAHRLRQVLDNLVGNAIKFTEHGEVRVSVNRVLDVEAADRDCVSLRFAVQDTGIGISAVQRERLFQPFGQADASIARRFGGSGLGLSICKRLVELMGGHIALDSEPGVGSTFSFALRFPAVPAETIPRSGDRERTSSQAGVPLRILVVEDTAVAREVAVELLRALGQEPDAVAGAAEALEALRRDRYDVVLMDKRMPGVDGLKLTRQIRRDVSLAQPYIVGVTANVLPEARAACLEAGMDAFLGKPVRLAELRRVLDEVARGRGRDRSGHGAVAEATVQPPQAERVAAPAEELLDRSVLDELLVAGPDGRSILERAGPLILQELARAASAIASAAPVESLESLAQQAHAVRGSLRMLGARAAAEVAARLEETALAGQGDATIPLRAELADLIGRTCTELERRLSPPGA